MINKSLRKRRDFVFKQEHVCIAHLRAFVYNLVQYTEYCIQKTEVKMITVKAYAKINLSLDVLRRLENGYHEVKMVMQQVDIFDVLTFEKMKDISADKISLEVMKIAPGVDIGPVENNLIYKAAKLIMDEYQINEAVKITLDKNIPVAAGMAGGSTDAAAVFHGLNELFGLNMSIKDMCALGVKIGADVPYCIMGGTALSEGIGEILTPVAAPPDCVLLVSKPNINVSTKYVYENLHANELKVHPDVDGMIAAIEEKNLEKMALLLGNVLETVTTNKYEIIGKIKKLMVDEGALNSLMSGSGPTVFGLFKVEDLDKAKKAASLIKDNNLAKEVFVTKFIN